MSLTRTRTTKTKNGSKKEEKMDILSSKNFLAFAKQINDEISTIPKEINTITNTFSTKIYGSYTNKMFLMVVPNFLDKKYADDLFEKLKSITYNTDEESMIKIMGRQMKIPRKQIAFGDPTAKYHFSGTSVSAVDWYKDDDSINSHVGRELMIISTRVSRIANASFNYVLVNNYIDQTNSIGYHSDDERELGKYPTVAGISLGQEREIYFKSNKTDEIIIVPLPHNSLYVMFYPTNQNWKHSIPKRAKHLGQRISLTYRQIKT